MQAPVIEADTVGEVNCIISLTPSGRAPLTFSIGTPRRSFRKERIDFLVDKEKQKAYAYLKHKRAIYLLALPIRSPSDGGQMKDCERVAEQEYRRADKNNSVLVEGGVFPPGAALLAPGLTKTAL